MLLLAIRLFHSRRATAAERLFAAHWPLAERLASRAAFRGGLVDADAEDFVSHLKLKLIEDDYARLRQRRGDSSIATFLAVVIQNLLHDYRNHLWGKYRPSAAARRLGGDAVRLERLLVRDHFDLETAIEMLRRNHGSTLEPEALREIAAELPSRPGRVFVGDEVLEHQGSDGDAETRIEDLERTASAGRIEEVLKQALEALDPEDLLILRMHLGDGFTIKRIADLLDLDQRALYRRRDRCFEALRGTFDARGLTWAEVREILGWHGTALHVDFGGTDGNAALGSVS